MSPITDLELELLVAKARFALRHLLNATDFDRMRNDEVKAMTVAEVAAYEFLLKTGGVPEEPE